MVHLILLYALNSLKEQDKMFEWHTHTHTHTHTLSFFPPFFRGIIEKSNSRQDLPGAN